MQVDDRNPSQVEDEYWIYATNQQGNYKVKRNDSGKWLIFEHKDEIDNLWRLIKMATRDGFLGNTSKTATAKLNRNATDNNYKVICVFTADFNDQDDVDRIARNIRSLGIENKLIYKLDKDVGKYQKQGYSNLSQKINRAKPFHNILSGKFVNDLSEWIEYMGDDKFGKRRFKFCSKTLDLKEIEEKKRRLIRIGFQIEKSGNRGRDFAFVE